MQTYYKIYVSLSSSNYFVVVSLLYNEYLNQVHTDKLFSVI